MKYIYITTAAEKRRHGLIKRRDQWESSEGEWENDRHIGHPFHLEINYRRPLPAKGKKGARRK